MVKVYPVCLEGATQEEALVATIVEVMGGIQMEVIASVVILDWEVPDTEVTVMGILEDIVVVDLMNT